MTISTLFIDHPLAVCLPDEMRFPGSVKKVDVRAVGMERMIAPVKSTWGSFFLGGQSVTDDFMSERADQKQSERDSL